MWLRACIAREWQLFSRSPAVALTPLLFCLAVLLVFVLASKGNNSTQFGAVANPLVSNGTFILTTEVLWVAFLLAGLLSTQHMFDDDINTGSLEQMLVAKIPFWGFVALKLAVLWVISFLPLVLLLLVLAAISGLGPADLAIFTLTLLISSVNLCCFGSMAAALMHGSRHTELLAPLLVLPLYLPLLIWGTEALNLGMHTSATSPLLILSGIMLLNIGFGLPATTAALRMATSGNRGRI